MTNIIKAPIKKIRRKGPNGEFTIHWDDVIDGIVEALEEQAQLELGVDDWRLIHGFYNFPCYDILSDIGIVTNNNAAIAAIVCIHKCGELKWFSLARLMPELECW